MSSESEIEKRKRDHLNLAESPSCQMDSSNGLNAIRFEPIALPELDFSEIDTQVEFLDKSLAFPFLISSMSGGVREADKINRTLRWSNDYFITANSLGNSFTILRCPSVQSRGPVSLAYIQQFVVGHKRLGSL